MGAKKFRHSFVERMAEFFQAALFYVKKILIDIFSSGQLQAGKTGSSVWLYVSCLQERLAVVK